MTTYRTGTSPWVSTYLAARYMAVSLVAVTTMLSGLYYRDVVFVWPAAAGAVILLTVTVIVVSARWSGRTPFDVLLAGAAVLDLVALGLIAIAFRHFGDPVYAALLAMPLFYSFVLRRIEAWVVGLAAAFVYLAAHAPFVSEPHLLQILLFLMKAGLIVFLGAVSAKAAARQEKRERALSRTTQEKAVLNVQLQRRITELQALTEVAEVIHSSLDFDQMGPLVAEILAKAMDVSRCGLYVVDTSDDVILFSAGVGMSGHVPSCSLDIPPGESGPTCDEGLTCLVAAELQERRVVFCGKSEVVDSLSEDDRLVLQSIAGELVVAVENSRLYKLSTRLAITDGLTGLHNYRYLQQRLEEELERARRYDNALSLLMIDLDDFKHFNDTFGHLAGDEALAVVARTIESVLREVDVACRFGGEEFSVILPETGHDGARAVAEKIRAAIAALELTPHGSQDPVGLTVSLGAASFPEHATGPEDLLRAADGALYAAKAAGKDRVRCAPSQASDAVSGDGE